jgi:diguanylate cyclase (GGDEF)-like protein/PAS domain S-box-containing protein
VAGPTWMMAAAFLGGGLVALAGLLVARWRGAFRRGARLRIADEAVMRAFENAPIGIAIEDRDGRFLRVNAAMCVLTGRSVDTLLNTSWHQITHFADVAAPLAFEHNALAGAASSFQMEKRYVRPDGSISWVLLNRTLVTDDDGVPLYFISQSQDLSDRKEAEAALTHQALHDPLTGLANRVLFSEHLSVALARSEERPSAVAVLLMDLDRFKDLNDSLGHRSGDRLLQAVAGRLSGVLRPGDTVARLGGDEFAILCADIEDVSHASRVAERVVEIFGQPYRLEDRDVYLNASVGIAASNGHDDGPEILLRQADSAMYRAKERGGGRWEVYDDRMQVQAMARLTLENALRRAVERDEFRLHYQPVVRTEDGRMVGAEALVRWQHPDRGLVQPAEFIPLAEETGLIAPIGRWVLQEACRQAAGWLDGDGSTGLHVSVNLSPRQLAETDLAEVVARALRETGLPPGALWLEITESALVEDAEATIATLLSLKRLGVRLCLDDFGSGYSSLGYLKRLPVDVLKIDRSFIDTMCSDPRDASIVSATVRLAHDLGLTPVAEGVETEAQMETLRELGCDLAQGFLFARPQEPTLVTDILGRGDVPVRAPAVAR